eukprot:4422795-Prymnesium_polylepis.1
MTTTPLFGGALAIALEGDWLDASDVRPVPDHQEVWTERNGTRALVVEILERVDAPTDTAAAAAHFEELSSTNAAKKAAVLSSSTLTIDALSASLRTAAPPALALLGVQELPDDTWLQVHLRLLRLRQQTTDILVSLCRPTEASPSDAAADGATQDAAMIDGLLRSLEIRDWGLFGDDS